MPPKRSKQRREAEQIYRETKGKITLKEIAEKTGATIHQVTYWKKADKWAGLLPKRGAPTGNQNAAGHGAPVGNKNAVTHGGYETMRIDYLTEEQQELLQTISLDVQSNMLSELQELILKRDDLTRKIKQYEAQAGEQLYTDKVIEVDLPNKENCKDSEKENKMKTTIKSTPWERIKVLEDLLNKVHGRILKLIDTMKSYEIEQQRAILENKKYTIMKGRALGMFEFDPEEDENEDKTDKL